MKKSEITAITKWADALTDEQLEKEYYSSVYDSLGSQTEQMYELGYNIADIKEREKYEKFLDQKSDIFGDLCEKRGIKLWEDTK